MSRSELLEVSFLIPAHRAESQLQDTVEKVHHYLQSNYPGSFEIILVPNGNKQGQDLTLEAAEKLSQRFSEVKTCKTALRLGGKGIALKNGFFASRGKRIFFSDADLPYDLSFFDEAKILMDQGYEFITGNRRLPNSRFTLPVSVLPLAYKRHRLGLKFNSLTRMLFPIQSRDTQAGIKAMSRAFAEKAFQRMICDGFLFDVEFFLVAKEFETKRAELPIHLYLNHEKTTVRIFHETLSIGPMLGRILKNYYQGHYGRLSSSDPSNNLLPRNLTVTGDDWGMSPAINRGILDLARRKILNRVSVIVDAPFASFLMKELLEIPQVQIGLHFNLTYRTRFSSPGKLIAHGLNPFRKKGEWEAWVRSEFSRQLEKLFGLIPTVSHIDGHHHVHIYPGIVEQIVPLAKARGVLDMRLPADPALWKTPKVLLLIFSLWAKFQFDRNGIKYKPCFYPQSKDFESGNRLYRALANKQGYEIILHPADEDDLKANACEDSYTYQRVTEFKAFGNILGNSGA